MTTYYIVSAAHDGTHIQRQDEYELALRKNLQNPQVKTVLLWVQGPAALARLATLPLPNRSKLCVVPALFQPATKRNFQPRLKDLIHMCNRKLAGEICVLACADNWLSHDFIIGEREFTAGRRAYALTRHEADGTCPQIDDYIGSHDAFVFRAPLQDVELDDLQFCQNHPGCDNVLVWALTAAGYQMSNPCRRLKIYHEHASMHREGHQEDWVNLHVPYIPCLPC